MKLVNHPNIVKLYQVMETKSMLYLVSEYVPRGEIFGKTLPSFYITDLCTLYIITSEYIAQHGRMSEKVARQKFWQMILAVEYCHSRYVISQLTINTGISPYLLFYVIAL